ncbi:hypothetical protein AKJ16_DCAP14631 [Drosera capensis]
MQLPFYHWVQLYLVGVAGVTQGTSRFSCREGYGLKPKRVSSFPFSAGFVEIVKQPRCLFCFPLECMAPYDSYHSFKGLQMSDRDQMPGAKPNSVNEVSAAG